MNEKATLLLLTVFFLTANVFAQNCPTISLSSPYEVNQGEMAVFTANVKDVKAGVNLTYNWMISSGTIVQGQGTSGISVNTKCLGGQTVTATVEIGGLSKDCSNTSSSTTSITGSPAETQLHSKGQYTTLKAFTDEANKFAADISSPTFIPLVPTAFIYLYPGKEATSGATLKTMTTALISALKKKGINPNMYKIITAGKRVQTSYEMWVVPECATEPQATPPDKELNMNGYYTNPKKFEDAANTFAGNLISEKYALQVPRAVILIYPGKNATDAEFNEMTATLKTVFTNRGLKSSMLTIIKGGKKPLSLTTYEMWIVSDGGTNPAPAPAQ
jgi:hypothetical protein